MKYDAFISYRHAPLDMEIAKKLHKALETYHIPKSVQKKTGKKKINRVFRDQEELPIGSDLNDNISAALKEAEYLIVICSPDTPESYWVLKEIETFIEMHDREHVLAILIDGEPWTSFPAPLLTDDAGNPVEPLAADIRGNTPQERNKKFQSEFLRLAAPLIGCTYDDLRQRHKERIVRRNITIGGIALGAVALFAAAFGTYNAITAAKMKKLAEEKAALASEKTQLAGEIMMEFKSKQENQSRFFAEESASLLKNGKREDAILLAKAGLPGKDDDRPFVSEAEYALSNALYAYDNESSYKFDRTLAHDYQVGQLSLNEDGSRLITIDDGSNISVWNTADSSLMARIPPIPAEKNGITTVLGASADDKNIYICYQKALIKYDYTGKEMARIEPEDYAFRKCDLHSAEKKAALIESDVVKLVDLESMSTIFRHEEQTGKAYSLRVVYSPEQDMILAENSMSESNVTCLSLLHCADDTCIQINVPGGYIAQTEFTANGNIAMVYTDGDYFTQAVTTEYAALYDTNGKNIWASEMDCTIVPVYPVYNLLGCRSFQKDDTVSNQIVVTVQYDTFTFDELTGKELGHFSHPSPVSGFYLFPKSNIGYFSFLNGEIIPVDTVSGLFYSEYTISTSMTITGLLACSREDTIYLKENNSSYAYSLTTPAAADKTKLPDFEGSGYYCNTQPEGKYYTFYVNGESVSFYDKDGNCIYTYDMESDGRMGAIFLNDTYVIIGHKAIHYINPLTKETEKKALSDFGMSNSVVGFTAFSNNCRYGIICSYNSVAVIDLEKKEMIGEYVPESSILGASVSPDGKTLFVALADDNSVKALDISTMSEIDLSHLNLKGEASKSSHSSIITSPDGRYLAVLGCDHIIRIVDLKDYSAVSEIPLNANAVFFMTFCSDNKTLIAQGADQRAYFYDVEAKEYTNTLDAGWGIEDVIFDDEDGLTAVTNGINLYLLNNKDYGKLAYVPDGVTFIRENNCFITKDKASVNSIRYKNYTELITEAEKQFPDISLSEQQRVKYNID